LKKRADSGDQKAKKISTYVQRTALDVGLGGPFLKTSLSDLINGLDSWQINTKQHQPPPTGGAPWLSPRVSIIPTQNYPKFFHKINTGIYDKDLVRSLTEIEEYSTVASRYTTYKN
jgi:hypothetical protein